MPTDVRSGQNVRACPVQRPEPFSFRFIKTQDEPAAVSSFCVLWLSLKPVPATCVISVLSLEMRRRCQCALRVQGVKEPLNPSPSLLPCCAVRIIEMEVPHGKLV